MIKSKFSDWTRADLEDTFALNQVWDHAVLQQWLDQANTSVIETMEQQWVNNLHQTLIVHVDDWNELELSEYFLGPILTLVNFNTQDFSIFADRELTGIIGDYELTGKPDAMVAKGLRRPKTPYFCFHEYKRENEPKGEPVSQVLVAMLVAQELNGHTMPIYGLYVAGKLWHFLILQGKEYCLSNAYVATRNEHLNDIVKILKALKQIISEMVT